MTDDAEQQPHDVSMMSLEPSSPVVVVVKRGREGDTGPRQTKRMREWIASTIKRSRRPPQTPPIRTTECEEEGKRLRFDVEDDLDRCSTWEETELIYARACERGDKALASRAADKMAKTKAESLKRLAKTHYDAKRYDQAEAAYAEALRSDPSRSDLSANRAAALFMLNRFRDCVVECERAVRLDATNLRAHLRMARAWMSLGEIDRALCVLARVAREATSAQDFESNRSAYEMTNQARLYLDTMERGDRALDREEPAVALTHAREALKIGSGASRAKCLEITANVMDCVLQAKDSANEWFDRLKSDDIKPEDALYYGCKLWARALRVQAKLYFQLAVKAMPGDSRAAAMLKTAEEVERWQKEATRSAREGKHREAARALDQAVNVDKTNDAVNGRLIYQRACFYMDAGDYLAAEMDCFRCLEKLPDYYKARVLRARVLSAKQDALGAEAEIHFVETKYRDKLDASSARGLRELRQRLRADKENKGNPPSASRKKKRTSLDGATKKSAHHHHYAFLGVDRTASHEQIKKAYKKAALKLHPDKNPSQDANEQFKHLVEVFRVLSSPSKRRQYDLTLLTL